MSNRECQRCNKVKQLTEFPRHPISKRPIATCRDCMPQYRRGGKPEREYGRQWARNNQGKRLAHKAVEYALIRGDLVREPCKRCSSDGLVYAHHDDYTKPFDVIWLCPPCHFQRHIEIGRPMAGRKKTSTPCPTSAGSCHRPGGLFW